MMDAHENAYAFFGNMFFPFGTYARCIDLLIRQAFDAARVIADAQGLYGILLVSAGCAVILPMTWASRTQARRVSDGLNLMARHVDDFRVVLDERASSASSPLSGRRLSTRIRAGHGASHEEILRMTEAVACLNGMQAFAPRAGRFPTHASSMSYRAHA